MRSTVMLLAALLVPAILHAADQSAIQKKRTIDDQVMEKPVESEFPTVAYVYEKLPRLPTMYCINLFHSAAVIVLLPTVFGMSHAKLVSAIVTLALPAG